MVPLIQRKMFLQIILLAFLFFICNKMEWGSIYYMHTYNDKKVSDSYFQDMLAVLLPISNITNFLSKGISGWNANEFFFFFFLRCVYIKHTLISAFEKLNTHLKTNAVQIELHFDPRHSSTLTCLSKAGFASNITSQDSC